jgi:hypothetical protein
MTTERKEGRKEEQNNFFSFFLVWAILEPQKNFHVNKITEKIFRVSRRKSMGKGKGKRERVIGADRALKQSRMIPFKRKHKRMWNENEKDKTTNWRLNKRKRKKKGKGGDWHWTTVMSWMVGIDDGRAFPRIIIPSSK